MAEAPTLTQLAEAVRANPDLDVADIVKVWEGKQADTGKAAGRVTTVDDLFRAASEQVAESQPEAGATSRPRVPRTWEERKSMSPQERMATRKEFAEQVKLGNVR